MKEVAMEELREEYKGCNLSDSQILTTKGANITSKQIHAIRRVKKMQIVIVEPYQIYNQKMKLIRKYGKMRARIKVYKNYLYIERFE
jgi:hypothetical protein